MGDRGCGDRPAHGPGGVRSARRPRRGDRREWRREPAARAVVGPLGGRPGPHREGPRAPARRGLARHLRLADPVRPEGDDRESARHPCHVSRDHGFAAGGGGRHRPDGDDDHQRARVHARDRRDALDRCEPCLDLQIFITEGLVVARDGVGASAPCSRGRSRSGSLVRWERRCRCRSRTRSRGSALGRGSCWWS